MKKSILLALFCAISIQSHAQLQLVYRQDLFLESVMRGYHDDVQLYLQSGINVYIKSPNYANSALYMASANGDIKMVKLLMSYGAYPAYEFNNSGTPLSIAVSSGHTDIVKLFIEAIVAKGDSDSIDWGYRSALENSRPEIAELFNKTGFVLSDGDQTSEERLEQQMKIYDLKYGSYTSNELRTYMTFYPADLLGKDLFKDSFLYYLKDVHPAEMTASHINAMMQHLMKFTDETNIYFVNIQKAIDILEIDISTADPKDLSTIHTSLLSYKSGRQIAIEVLTFWFKNGLNPLLIPEEYVNPPRKYAFDPIKPLTPAAKFVKKEQKIAKKEQKAAEVLAKKGQKAAEKEQKAAEKLALKEQKAAKKAEKAAR